MKGPSSGPADWWTVDWAAEIIYLHLVFERHEKAHRAEFSLKFRILILELYRFELTVYPNYLKTDHQLVHHGEHFGKLNWKFRMKTKT